MDLDDPLETRDTLQIIIGMVSNEIHAAVAMLSEPGDELVITVERRIAPEREPDMSDDWLAVSEDEEEVEEEDLYVRA